MSRRWLLIQLHRAQIARLTRSSSPRRTDEVARRMNAIALLCDCGRTEVGQQLAITLAQARVPDLATLSLPSAELVEPS